MSQAHSVPLSSKKDLGFVRGLLLALILAVLAQTAASLPLLRIMGPLVLAILFGMAWRAVFGIPAGAAAGIGFSSKKLLRLGIILLGMRLSWPDMVQAGPKVFLLAAVCLVFALAAVYGLCRMLGIDRRLGLLTACGTAICGAAAVVAIAPQVKAGDEETAVSAAIVALLGTAFTLSYTLLMPFVGLSSPGYGAWSGATLHEIAHVLAAAAPGGQEALRIALLVKLSRVALLVPVAVAAGWWTAREERKLTGQQESPGRSWRQLPIPWFIFGFLLVSGIHSLGILPAPAVEGTVTLSYTLLAMAMAGLGLNVDLGSFRRLGLKPLAAGLLGSMLLSGFGRILVSWFGLN
ncbi:YeiH family protein [Paenibacillus filicis]|uniref:YeiH family protein n=1 Tax=Paenibacillus gyeongsangnamensis TaxID=3388067 RepID=A0ABT4QBL6_9BACL|nr:YeiH family protein [Paenibacillus filicis]MCZ8514176.1 YeiH family protein [Paenibacillus filicis]